MHFAPPTSPYARMRFILLLEDIRQGRNCLACIYVPLRERRRARRIFRLVRRIGARA